MTSSQHLHILRWRVDWGLLATLAMTLFTTIPLLMHPAGLTNGADVLYHTYRVAEMDRSWAHGLLMPRWAEGLYYGYGSPIFQYYASLAYTIASALMRLLGASPLEALRVLIVLCMLIGSGGMYLFMKRRAGVLGGIIAGLVYVYSPYILYTETYTRGAYPELLALCLFPLVLWRFDCLLTKASGANLWWASITHFLLIISHNLMALALTSLLAAWLVAEMGFRLYRERSWKTILSLLPTFGALAAGIGLAAYFWIPVLLEADAVNLHNLTAVPLLDFRYFFIPFADMFGAIPINDGGAINGLDTVDNLGIAQWGLALTGLIGWLFARNRGQRRNHGLVLFAALMSFVLIYFMLPLAIGLWKTLPGLSYLQFPWRLLGPAAVCLAVLAGMNAVWIERLPRYAFIGLSAAVALPVLTVMPLLYVPEWTNIDVPTSIAAYHAVEIAGRQRGTTFTDEYRPRTVYNLPSATERLLDDYADGYPVDKLSYNSLPDGATVELIANNPQYNEWRLTTPTAFTLEILTFDWAGWTAEVDGQQVEITASPNHGFITFPVPAGEHTVKVYLGTTAARQLGNGSSIVTLIVLIGAAFWLQGRPILAEQPEAPATPRPVWIGVAVGGAVTLVLVLALFREGIAWYDSEPGTAEPAQVQVVYNLDDRFQVLGYTLNSREFRPGDWLRLQVYWYPLSASDVNFSSFLHVSRGGPPVAQIDKLHPAGRAVPEWWTPDGYIIDKYDLVLPETLEAGEYQVNVGLYTCELMPPGDCGNGYRPTVTDTEGRVVGDTVPLGDDYGAVDLSPGPLSHDWYRAGCAVSFIN